MSSPIALIAILTDAHGAAIARARLPMPLGELDFSLALTWAIDAAKGHGRARGVDVQWLSGAGAEAPWCSLSNIGLGAGAAGNALPERVAQRSSRQLCRPVSLRLMPDYGGAALWDPNGDCSALEAGDYLSAAKNGRTMEFFELAIERWQTHFEAFSDSGLGAGALESGPRFAWSPFSSKAAALALRSRALLGAPLHVMDPWENVSARAEPGGRAVWLPEWEDQDEAARGASRALERLDEAGFMLAWRAGARQDPSAPMPWAVYCAHLRLGGALAAIVPGSGVMEGRCFRGCSVFEAAMLELWPRGLELALEGRALPQEPEGDSWCEALARQSSAAIPGEAAQCLRVLARAGARLPEAEWLARQAQGPRLSELAAEAEAIALGQGLASGCEASPARTRAL